jgi:hypothetical protein
MPLDLRQFDEDFTPAPSTANLSRPEDLTDGVYEFEITSAQLKNPKGHNILELHLVVLTPGVHDGMNIQFSKFLDSAEAAARIGRDLATLGFDTGDWKVTNGRPFSVEFDKAVKLLPGLRWRGTKKTSQSADGTKTYHNLFVDERVRTDGKPERFGPAELNAAAEPDDPFGSLES